MNKIFAILTVSFAVLSQAAFGCDEQCAKEKAQTKHNVIFPGHLSWKNCEDTALDFMNSAMRSLNAYKDKHKTKFKGPLKNTRHYLTQRKEWLMECDDYLSKTKNIRIFNDDKTTKQIFAAIDSINNEFSALIAGASYASETEATAVMGEKIDSLYQQVDDHKTIMHLKGRYVVR